MFPALGARVGGAVLAMEGGTRMCSSPNETEGGEGKLCELMSVVFDAIRCSGGGRISSAARIVEIASVGRWGKRHSAAVSFLCFTFR